MNEKPSLSDAAAAADAGDIPKATKILTGLLAQTPHDPAVHYNLGIIAAAAGDTVQAARHLDDAILHAERALRADPTSAAGTLLARYLVAAGRQADAGRFFGAIREDAHYDLLMSYGQVFTQLGQRESAIAAYDAAAGRRALAVTKNTSPPAAWAKHSPFSAENPSPRYGALLAQYEAMHDAGRSDTHSEGAKTFEGFVGFSIMAPYVRRFARELGAQSMLDYGGGRGAQYQLGPITLDDAVFPDPKAYLGIDHIVCFDPGFTRALPPDTLDLVICIDALEHCDRQDLPWIVRQLFAKARLGVFANIASYPAAKILPNGENAHCTVEDSPWWMALFGTVAEDFPAIRYQVIVSKDLRQNNRTVFGGGTA